MNRPVAHLALGVATVNDIIGWLLLGVVVGVAESGTFEVGPLGVAVVVVLATSFVVLRYGPRCLDRLSTELEQRSGGQAAEISLLTLFVVAIGMITHAAGIEVVIGAFIAGIAIGGVGFATAAASLRSRPSPMGSSLHCSSPSLVSGWTSPNLPTCQWPRGRSSSPSRPPLPNSSVPTAGAESAV